MSSLRCMRRLYTLHKHKKINNSLPVNQTMISTRMYGIFHASPSPALVDDKTRYSIEGLRANQSVTVVAVLKEETLTYLSHAHYTADGKGMVDLSEVPSTGGSYTGVEPMGLLWAMAPQRGSPNGVRLMKKVPGIPFSITFNVIDGIHDVTSEVDIENKKLICTKTHKRSYMAPGVRKIMIKQGQLRGALFLPQGEGPFPGVIDLFGTAGGLIQCRSALLASRGFASLAQAYFNYDDLGSKMSWNMECFEEAVDFMTTHNQVKSGGIGAIAVSKGTELVSYMAIYSSLVKAVVCIGEHRKNGMILPNVWPQGDKMIFGDEGLVLGGSFYHVDVPDETLLKVEEAKGAEYLFITGEDDQCTYTIHTDLLIDRLKKHGKSNYQLLRYPGAGHLIEPPFTPHMRVAYHKLIGQVVLFGGNMKDHAYAQEDSWRKILAFFKSRLDNQNTSAVHSSCL